MDGFPSGQRGQTVNLLQIASVVRIHLHPFALMSSMEQCLARKSMQSSITQCVRWCGGIGRRKGLKIPRGQLRAGSSPATRIFYICGCGGIGRHDGFRFHSARVTLRWDPPVLHRWILFAERPRCENARFQSVNPLLMTKHPSPV